VEREEAARREIGRPKQGGHDPASGPMRAQVVWNATHLFIPLLPKIFREIFWM
jgi:hypothetical protein